MRRYYKAQFDLLCEMEPGLSLLERRVIRLGNNTQAEETFCANRQWLWIKPAIARLVGWRAKCRDKHPELGTNKAYDIACGYLYYLLPDCRSCVCMAVEEILGLR